MSLEHKSPECPASPTRGVETICKRTNARFSLFPIQHPDLWQLAKTQQAQLWTAEEADLGRDKHDFDARLTENERHFVKHVLAFFAAADGVVNENIESNFADEITVPEARYFYAWQEAMEAVHQESYGLMIQTLIPDKEEAAHLFNALDTIPVIREKAEWAMQYMDRGRAPLNIRLLAFLCTEGIQFSGSFCAIFYLKSKNLLPGLAFLNELIARDEGLHAEFACALYQHLDDKASTDDVHALFRSAVDVEVKFCTDALPVGLLGINAVLMAQYIRYVADFWLVRLGYPKLYHAQNPFVWMEIISVDRKSNFFEARESSYAKSGVAVTEEEREIAKVFSLDDEF